MITNNPYDDFCDDVMINLTDKGFSRYEIHTLLGCLEEAALGLLKYKDMQHLEPFRDFSARLKDTFGVYADICHACTIADCVNCPEGLEPVEE